MGRVLGGQLRLPRAALQLLIDGAAGEAVADDTPQEFGVVLSDLFDVVSEVAREIEYEFDLAGLPHRLAVPRRQRFGSSGSGSQGRAAVAGDALPSGEAGPTERGVTVTGAPIIRREIGGDKCVDARRARMAILHKSLYILLLRDCGKLLTVWNSSCGNVENVRDRNTNPKLSRNLSRRPCRRLTPPGVDNVVSRRAPKSGGIHSDSCRWPLVPLARFARSGSRG